VAKSTSVSIAPIAVIGMIIGFVLLGGIGYVGDFPYREIVFVIVCGLLTSSILGIALARRHRIKAIIGASLVSVLPSFVLLVVIDITMENNHTLGMVMPGFLLLLLITGVIAYAYAQPPEDVSALPKKREKDSVGRIVYDCGQMPGIFGAAQYIPNFVDPLTKQSAGPNGRGFEVYPCPNIQAHGTESFYMSKASWVAKNFFCPRCATALMSEDWSKESKKC
jgi:hypothetical protein